MNINRLLASVLSSLLLLSCSKAQSPPPLDRIRLPGGFHIEVYADHVPNARSMVRSPGGTLYVGTRRQGQVYALPDKDRDGYPDTVLVIASGLNMPNGVAWRAGDLYVAEVGRILKYPDIEQQLPDVPEPEVVTDIYPEDRWHGWKYIAFGPDGYLYVPVGAPCNVCLPEDSIYATITRIRPDGTGLEIYAKGVRNSVGFAWHPDTQELWFTDNGRDMLGDDLPPDELNHAYRKGLHFGFPYCHGRNIPDPEFGTERSCSEFEPPAMELGPHVAALGMKFYTGNSFPQEYWGDIFIAEHGSWNRSVPIGYRITRVRMENGKAVSYAVFAEGWLQGDKAWGRPVDLLLLPDGSMLVSDDRAGKIYRIYYAE